MGGFFHQADRVGPGRLVQGDDGALLVVDPRKGQIFFHTQFNPGNILYFDLGAALAGAHHDFTEFFFVLQPFGQTHRVCQFGARRGRLASQLAARHDHALGTNRVHYFGNGDPQLGQAVGLDPDPHGIIGGTQHVYPADTADTCQHVLDVDQGIVAQKILIETSVIGAQGDHHQDVGH